MKGIINLRTILQKQMVRYTINHVKQLDEETFLKLLPKSVILPSHLYCQ